MREARAERRSMSSDDDDAVERPIRRSRDMLAPILSPIPEKPAYDSHPEEERDNKNDCMRSLDAVPEWRREETQDSPRRPAVLMSGAGTTSFSEHRAADSSLTLPQAASPPVIAVSAQSQARAGANTASEDQRDLEKLISNEGLISSLPRSLAQDGKQRPLFGDVVYRSAVDKGDDKDYSKATERAPRPAHKSSKLVHQPPDVTETCRREKEDSDGHGVFSAATERRQSQESSCACCVRCQYRPPEELIRYLQEISSRRFVPHPHCPGCGAQLVLSVKATSSDDDDSVRDDPQKPPRYTEHVHVSKKHRCESQSGSAEPTTRIDRCTVDAASSFVGDLNHESQPPRGVPPESSRPKTNTAKWTPSPGLCHSEAPVPQYVVVDHSSAEPKPTNIMMVFLARSPYLTPESLPCSLESATRAPDTSSSRRRNRGVSSSLISPDNSIAVPWAVNGCMALTRQAGVGLSGCFCCAMPLVLFRERQQILLHKVRSRYICCAGAFPCCVPPASLRPELYYTMEPRYFHSSAVNAAASRYGGDVEDANAEVSRERYRDDLYGGSSDGGQSRLPEARLDGGERCSFAAFRSVKGISSPASLVNPRTGLPLMGCYSNCTVDQSGQSPTSASLICEECRDCGDSCCLYCAHPTAYSLACPLCCMCFEVTFCMPCALWANRLLIRQHYHLTPDTAIDSGALWCYTSCLRHCTCTQVYTAATASAPTPNSISCEVQLATTLAACLAAVFCLCPCAPCSLAQQRDQILRLGYPLLVGAPSGMEMM
ncbi:hypothetical protein JKF63_05593 [Porcisia hertigi]|uniref:Uncharacterized protein n=1 Tax=Porcisia hertigi TaxID=2761500 RepID=A0A836I5U1_9TRYP|nr:hypothetical protein JKF63_05593 [Porcisia hertigi]